MENGSGIAIITHYLTVKRFTWLVLHYRLMDTIRHIKLEEEGIRKSSGLAQTYLDVFRIAPDL